VRTSPEKTVSASSSSESESAKTVMIAAAQTVPSAEMRRSDSSFEASSA
jgi:hypothetical protein